MVSYFFGTAFIKQLSKTQIFKKSTKQPTLLLTTTIITTTNHIWPHHHPPRHLLRRLPQKPHLPHQTRKQRTNQNIPPRNLKPILLKHNQARSLINGKIRITNVGFNGQSFGTNVDAAGETPCDGDCVGDGGVDERGYDLGAGGGLIEYF